MFFGQNLFRTKVGAPVKRWLQKTVVIAFFLLFFLPPFGSKACLSLEDIQFGVQKKQLILR
jgi:hypothetical protein